MALNVNPDRALLGDSNRHLIGVLSSRQNGSLTAGSVRSFLEHEGDLLRREGESRYYLIRERFNADHDSHDFCFSIAHASTADAFNKRGGFNTPFCRKPERFRPPTSEDDATKCNGLRIGSGAEAGHLFAATGGKF